MTVFFATLISRLNMGVNLFLNQDYKVLEFLVNLQGNDAYVSVKQETISEETGISKNKVGDILKKLINEGYITSVEKRGNYTVSNTAKKIIKSIQNVDDSLSGKTLKFIDLFAGIGGIRKGFEDENTECVFSCEWDKYAQKTYYANFGEIPYGDITKIDEKDIPCHDVVLAGFPCQPFSMIGKREGLDDEKGRGTLFFDVLRIIKFHKPKMVLLENVPGLLTIQNGETFKLILKLLKEAGYTVFSDVLDSADFGLPQSRKRVLIVCFRKDLKIDKFEFPKTNNSIPLFACDILEKNPKGYSISKKLQQSYLFKKDDGHPQIIDENSKVICKTLCASYHKIQRITGTFVKGGETGVRLLSELECKRLMGYPDDFKFPVSRTQMYHQLGNSVCVPVIKSVSDAMKEVYNRHIQYLM